jgi:hypothetical protein
MLTLDRLTRRFGSVIGRRGSQHGSQRDERGPSRGRIGACDLGALGDALGGTRTPTL